jgi:ATP-dependent helicase/nuclease subunit A
MMKLTNQQTEAIITEGRALLVEAGAGTGKTSVLVQRFMHLLGSHPDWQIDNIVAVTYTDKATREMRSRMREAVETRARQAHPGSPWHDRRRDLDRLRVSTIHGFCARLLRENAIAAGLDPRFQVLDEQAADQLKMEAIHKALAELVDESNPLLRLLASIRVSDLRNELDGLLGKRGTVHRLFQQLPSSSDLLVRWQQGVVAMQYSLWSDLVAQNPAIIDLLREVAGLTIKDPGDKLAEAVRLAQRAWECLVAGDIAGMARSLAQINLQGGKQANWGGAEAIRNLRDNLKAVRDPMKKEITEKGLAKEVDTTDEAAAAFLHQWRQLWDCVSGVYDRLKVERQVLDFDDLELATWQLLCQEPRDSRLAAYVENIHHLMIDEFQDTNELQQGIIYAVAHPSDAGRLFAVGDAKQSIYRFRQAQVSVFNQTGTDIEGYTGCSPLPLNCSFRTHETLVEALNFAFDRVMRPLGETYAGYEARPGPLKAERPSPPAHPAAPAPVELIVFPEQDADGNHIGAEEARVWEGRTLAERLMALKSEGFQVWDKGLQCYRPFRLSDAAILFRATTTLPLFEEQFKTVGLPYLTVSGRGYYDRPEVKDLVALLTCLQNPADDLGLAATLRSPLFNLSDETLFQLRWHGPDGMATTDPIPLLAALEAPPPNEQASQVNFAAETLRELRAMTGRVWIAGLLRVALDLTGYEAVLALTDHLIQNPSRSGSDGGGRSLGNVEKFLKFARERAGVSLSEFLEQLRNLREREAREGEAIAGSHDREAVQLMSIHAAKGLEFPVVVVADLGRDQARSSDSSLILHDPAFGLVCKHRDEDGDWQKPASYLWGEWMNQRMDLAESARQLYVACTRAGDLLILSGRQTASDSWLNTLLASWEIDNLDSDHLITRPGFAIRLVKPSAPTDFEFPAAAASETDSLCLTDIPALIHRIPTAKAHSPIAVTHLEEHVARVAGHLPTIRPAARQMLDDYMTRRRAPGSMIGNLVHRALADWSCLSQPAGLLRTRLADWACAEGAIDLAVRNDAVAAAERMISALVRSPLHQAVCRATRRHVEVPFTLDSPGGVLHGVIDLLFQDAEGCWYLVDWKTELVRMDQVANAAQEHLFQMAAYSHAAQKAIGQQPNVLICFLAAKAVVFTCNPAELKAAWDRMVAANTVIA